MDPFLNYLFLPIIVIFLGFLIVKFTQKQPLSKMNSFDMLVLFIISHILAQPIVTRQPLLFVYSLIIIVLFYIGISFLTFNNKIPKFLAAKPAVLISDGEVNERGLRRVQLSHQELLESIRKRGYKTVDVEFAVMEDFRKMKITPKKNVERSNHQGISIPIIMDGEIIEQNLKYVNKDHNWLNEQLMMWNHSTENISDITIATINANGELFVQSDINEWFV